MLTIRHRANKSPFYWKHFSRFFSYFLPVIY